MNKYRFFKTMIPLTFTFILCLDTALAQPNPSNSGNGTMVGGQPIGGGAAPMDDASIWLIVLSAGYAAKKITHYRVLKKRIPV